MARLPLPPPDETGEHHPLPAPRPGNDEVGPVAAGTLIWALLAVAAFAFRDDLVADDREWWLWTALTGVALGLLGLLYLRRRRDRARARWDAGQGTTSRS